MKKSTIALIAGASMMAMAGSASALDINIYGASAQYTFWNNLSNDYLTSQGCTTIVGPVNSTDGKQGVVTGTGTGNCAGVGITLRYASKASYDGIFATMGSCNGQTGCNPNPDSCGNSSRKFLTSTASNSVTSCQTVTIGASDVAPASFTQQTHGLLKGPNGGAQTDRVFTGITIPSNVHAQHGGVVVPFGFFANKTINVSKCADGPKAGQQCRPGVTDPNTAGLTGGPYNLDCEEKALNFPLTTPHTYTYVNHVCNAAAPIDNVSREMVANIFSGNSVFWSDFGDGYTVTGKTAQVDDNIVACLRHAGSGTHSTFDWAVMKGSLGVAQNQTAGGPVIWFNDGSSDEMACVNTLAGAIGYSDADQLAASNGVASPYTNTVALNYQGFAPTRVNVRNGLYDFWTNEWLFINETTYPVGSAQHNQFNNLIAYASNPANINVDTLQGKADYWTTKAEMVYEKATDQVYPVWTGAGSKQNP